MAGDTDDVTHHTRAGGNYAKGRISKHEGEPALEHVSDEEDDDDNVDADNAHLHGARASARADRIAFGDKSSSSMNTARGGHELEAPPIASSEAGRVQLTLGLMESESDESDTTEGSAAPDSMGRAVKRKRHDSHLHRRPPAQGPADIDDGDARPKRGRLVATQVCSFMCCL